MVTDNGFCSNCSIILSSSCCVPAPPTPELRLPAVTPDPRWELICRQQNKPKKSTRERETEREREREREREKGGERNTHLKAVSKLLAGLGKLPAAETGHTPGRPDDAGIQLTLGGHLHGQFKLVLLHETVPHPPGQLWLGQLLDGGDNSGSRRYQLTEEVHSTQVPAAGDHMTVT